MVDMRGDWTYSALIEAIDAAMWDARTLGHDDFGLDEAFSTPDGFHIQAAQLADEIWKGLDGL